MDEHGRPAYREPPRSITAGTDHGRMQLLIVVVIGALVIQVIRPWGDGASGRASTAVASAAVAAEMSPTTRAIPATPSTDPEPASASRLHVTCGSTDGWRATTTQVWPDRAIPIRSWIAIEPVGAGDPLDTAIPFAPVAADEVTAIGFCAPLDEALRPPVSIRPSLWRISGGRAVPLALVPADPADHDALRGLWLPPSGVGAIGRGVPADAWPPGRYVIELATPGGTYRRRLGIEILDLGGPGSPVSSSPSVEPIAEPPDGGRSPGS